MSLTVSVCSKDVLSLWLQLQFPLFKTKTYCYNMEEIFSITQSRGESIGIVHPINVIIYSPSICFKPVWISFFCWTQKKISWRTSVTKQLMDPNVFLHCKIIFSWFLITTMFLLSNQLNLYSSDNIIFWVSDD